VVHEWDKIRTDTVKFRPVSMAARAAV